jgi:hypothetical protein
MLRDYLLSVPPSSFVVLWYTEMNSCSLCNIHCCPQGLFNGRAAQQFCRATQLQFQAYQVLSCQVQFGLRISLKYVTNARIDMCVYIYILCSIL